MIDAPLIRICRTMHRRFEGSAHAFSYDLPYYWFEIDQLSGKESLSPFFSINKFNLVSLHHKDYLEEGLFSIKNKLLALIDRFKIKDIHKTYLLTFPRVLLKNFNPVSFYYQVDTSGNIQSILAEITNTYHDKHVMHIKATPGKTYIDNRQDKVFHVSPFQPDQGTYHFRIKNSIQHIEIHIRLIKDGKTLFYANLIEKETLEMNTPNLLRTTLRFPIAIIGTMPRILFQAAILHFKKHIPAGPRPIPTHPDTLRRRPPTLTESWCMHLVFSRLMTFSIGTLKLILPDGKTLNFGTDTSLQTCWKIEDYAVFKALVFRGELGMGETYVAGQWTADSLVDVLTYFLRNRHHHKTQLRGSKLSKAFGILGHWLRRNTLSNSVSNIQAHYDLSNEMYGTFLDAGMNYSSAFYSRPDMSLEDAQLAKIDRLIQCLHILPTHHVLEIGSGWGAAAIRLVQTTGCTVTTLTLSQAQHDLVSQKVKDLNLDSKIFVRLEDYRDHRGIYDRILSIEMIEAVGHAYLPAYFKSIDHLLAPNGIVAIQAITIPDQRYSDYRRRVDWIQKYIFPGGHLPSLSAIQSALATHTQLTVEKLENIAPHYAKTLVEWRARFLAHRDEVTKLGFDNSFIRKWVYYLTYCEAGFSNRYINCMQLVLTRPVNLELIRKDRQVCG